MNRLVPGRTWVWVGPVGTVRPLQINQMSGPPLYGVENLRLLSRFARFSRLSCHPIGVGGCPRVNIRSILGRRPGHHPSCAAGARGRDGVTGLRPPPAFVGCRQQVSCSRTRASRGPRGWGARSGALTVPLPRRAQSPGRDRPGHRRRRLPPYDGCLRRGPRPPRRPAPGTPHVRQGAAFRLAIRPDALHCFPAVTGLRLPRSSGPVGRIARRP